MLITHLIILDLSFYSLNKHYIDYFAQNKRDIFFMGERESNKLNRN